MQRLINGTWESCTQEDLVDGDWVKIIVGDGTQEYRYMTPQPEEEV